MAGSADLMFHDPAIVPGTHALVIGIGEYPHVIGGEAPAHRTDGLRQLSSPPVSARAFARWLLNDYRCPDKALASLSLLTSEPGPAPFEAPAGVPHEVPVGGIEAIVEAVRQWKLRGDSSPDNRLIFYFCGHGISQGADMALLAREFCFDDANPLDSSLDFRQLVNGLRKCAAQQQIFFVDACRANSDLLVGQDGGLFVGRVPLLGGGLPRREAVTFYSTLAGDQSYARPNDVSFFTQAMLRALRGAGSNDPTGEWWVSTSGLHEAISHFMTEPIFAGAAAGVQVPAVNAMPVFGIHQLVDLPVVPVYVSCEPWQDNAVARFGCWRDGTEALHRDAGEQDPADPSGRWVLDLPVGDYVFEAKVAPGDVRRSEPRSILPVYREVKLERSS